MAAAGTAVSVTTDLTNGMIERLRTMDVGATSILAGHVVASVARNTVSTVLVLGVAFKRDVDDVRESPALDVITLLRDRGADVVYHAAGGTGIFPVMSKTLTPAVRQPRRTTSL